MGAYYGSSLLVTQQYLLVGAPMYNMKAYEEGCVFIYRNDRDDLLLWQTICGQQKGGRFGTAITSFGRIDNYVKPIGVAISAPYADDNAGIVYIYVEHRSGFKELQQISGKTISSDVIGFGISLSNSLDIDQNGYNDFAVGSLASTELVVLRSRKVLDFQATLHSHVDKISTTTKDITVSYCITYLGHFGDRDYVEPTVTLESDARVFIEMPIRPLTLVLRVNQCINFTLTIKPHAFDSPLPLKLKATSTLQECPQCSIAHPKPPPSTLEIPFVTGCGDDNICVPDLQLQAQFDDATELIIGTRDDLPLTVVVSNLGETA
ncbi:Integrin alpha [Popillia japonica]|uniref:Integrin alpha n=1 Tax=Popillia japonica TaxID=7064 RepID=A0AAW1IVJ0_POPJA